MSRVTLVRAVASAAAGSALTVAALTALGYVPLFFGFENRSWSKAYWNSSANALISELFANGYSVYRPKGSFRNFLDVTKSTPERRLRKVFFFSREKMELVGIVHFGPDLEGPPGCVHGGCTAAYLDSAAGVFAYRATRLPCVTASLRVDYSNKIPLGSTLLTVGTIESMEGRKIWLNLKLTDLKQKAVYASAKVLMINSIAPAKAGELPAFLRMNTAAS